MQYLRDEGSTSTIGLWGRSMGAVTALLYAQRDPTVAGVVLDSPFARLTDLMLELGSSDAQLRVPRPIIRVSALGGGEWRGWRAGGTGLETPGWPAGRLPGYSQQSTRPRRYAT